MEFGSEFIFVDKNGEEEEEEYEEEVMEVEDDDDSDSDMRIRRYTKSASRLRTTPRAPTRGRAKVDDGEVGSWEKYYK